MAQIRLNETEKRLLASIELDQRNLDHKKWQEQGPLAQKLMASLIARSAIPEVRWNYWTDPSYQIGRIQSSHCGLFERNGTTGLAIFSHPHFLEYLYYFIFGAKLDHQVKMEVENAVGDPQFVSSGDLTKICSSVRAIARKYDCKGDFEEFYRHALDLGLSLQMAAVIRKAVRKIT